MEKTMTKSLFAIVDAAIGEALATRPSKLDTLDLEEWTREMLDEDAADVARVIDQTAAMHGWTGDSYNYTYRRLRDNRHHSY
jgi:hypothetical protein